jgi:aspartyl aminopeptidase
MAQPVDRDVNEKLVFNKETEFVPILGLLEKELNGKKDTSEREAGSPSSVRENHHLALLSLLANEHSISPEEIHDFEL